MNSDKGRDLLVQARQSFLRGQITPESANRIIDDLILVNAHSPQKEIVLWLDSIGGDSESAFKICNTIKAISSPVTAKVIGQANSSAFLVLQYCNKREAGQLATLMLHTISRKNVELKDIRERGLRALEETERLQEIYEQIISARSGQAKEEVARLCMEGRIMSATEALSLGFLDEIY
ncbi:MAG: ATP-dependent Clp protease proteolytic subunit [Patescibacteria group bacterium]|jgi:ATP-dependent Clp protease protease subunit